MKDEPADTLIVPLNRQPPPATPRPERAPLAACDCDHHCNVDICGVDEVEGDVCGVYGG